MDQNHHRCHQNFAVTVSEPLPTPNSLMKRAPSTPSLITRALKTKSHAESRCHFRTSSPNPYGISEKQRVLFFLAQTCNTDNPCSNRPPKSVHPIAETTTSSSHHHHSPPRLFPITRSPSIPCEAFSSIRFLSFSIMGAGKPDEVGYSRE